MEKEYELTDQSHGTIDVAELSPLDSDTSAIMKSEFRTGIKLSSFYYVFIFFIPVINWFFKDFAFFKFWGGMSVTWFLTTIAGMGMAFLIAYIHTKRYEKRLAQYEQSVHGNKGKGGVTA
ncbi:hypothetical protein [Neobacillus mesonae]|uniref:hypothetical protein n=1 Tax=Neobacillus mesonae TaxID=1193713 RepID=UPI000AA4A2CB|nr:hypothetical protein [Neobacillus mesonae]MED4203116.1 hypothetical protein [Neobacillus mesonae]